VFLVRRARKAPLELAFLVLPDHVVKLVSTVLKALLVSRVPLVPMA
jgi:hypothetical protein